jgi:hypothetical protein
LVSDCDAEHFVLSPIVLREANAVDSGRFAQRNVRQQRGPKDADDIDCEQFPFHVSLSGKSPTALGHGGDPREIELR